jgi:polyphosphate kinase 2
LSNKKNYHRNGVAPAGELTPKAYDKDLYLLQVELVKLQREIIAENDRILVIVEGRDTAGKDGTIKRIVEHLSPRETRVVALGKPSDREAGSWYFQRYVRYLPVPQEMVLFNRSWYNRAGVERVMGFCSDAEYREFQRSVPDFEQMLVGSGIKLIKYYLDISKSEQKKRLQERAVDPLKQWKLSPVDDLALRKWKQYSAARDAMLTKTHTPAAPWTIVRADDKHQARLNLIRDLLGRLDYRGKSKALLTPDPEILFSFSKSCLKNGRIAQ